MTPEQIEIVAKLKEIEEQATRLLDENIQLSSTGNLARTRVVHIQNLAKYLRSTVATDLVLVKKKSASD